MRAIIFFVLITIPSLSCKTGLKFSLPAQEYAPKRSFKYYKERHWEASSGLRTDGIYYSYFPDTTNVVFYRFFEDGYMIYDGAFNKGTLQSILSYQKQLGYRYPYPDLMGYFKVSNDSLFFSEKSLGNKKNTFYNAKIFNDSIVVYPLNKKQERTEYGPITYKFAPFCVTQ